MADIVNPYANPYLPAFINQRPRINEIKPQPVFGSTFSQIHPVKGFDGAREYAAGLANGSSEILTESDPEIARIYIVAKDQNGQILMQPFKLIPEEEPKPVTMDDLNAKMSELLERMNKLEEEKSNGKSGNGTIGKNWQRDAEWTKDFISVNSTSSDTGNAAK